MTFVKHYLFCNNNSVTISAILTFIVSIPAFIADISSFHEIHCNKFDLNCIHLFVAIFVINKAHPCYSQDGWSAGSSSRCCSSLRSVWPIVSVASWLMLSRCWPWPGVWPPPPIMALTSCLAASWLPCTGLSPAWPPQPRPASLASRSSPLTSSSSLWAMELRWPWPSLWS